MTKIERCGRLLFGDHWRTPLAEALEVNERTLRRWVNGEFRPPPGVYIELRKMMLDRGLELARLADSKP